MKMFFSGGCKNGKSSLAENCAVKLAKGGPLYYIATMIPHDDEDRERIRRHIESRFGKGFITIEQGLDIPACVTEENKGGTFLVDSVTALLSNEMFLDGRVIENAGEKAADDLVRFASMVKNAVFVSDFIYASSESYDELTIKYRKGLADCDRALAGICDTVCEVFTGHTLVYKGEMP